MRNSSLSKLEQVSSDMSKPRTSLDSAAHIFVKRHSIHSIHNNNQMSILTTVAKRAIAMTTALGTDADFVLVAALDSV